MTRPKHATATSILSIHYSVYSSIRSITHCIFVAWLSSLLKIVTFTSVLSQTNFTSHSITRAYKYFSVVFQTVVCQSVCLSLANLIDS